MGIAFLYGSGGGGAGLNFFVVGGTTQPTGKENLVWVNTSTPITSWVVSPNEPESPTTGMVWIQDGTTNGIDVLKRIQLKFSHLVASSITTTRGKMSRRIYLKIVRGRSFRGQDFISSGTVLNKYPFTAKGIKNNATTPLTGKTPAVTHPTGYVQIVQSSGSTCGLYISDAHTLTGSLLCFDGYGVIASNRSARLSVFDTDAPVYIGDYIATQMLPDSRSVVQIDISQIPAGQKYLGFTTSSNTSVTTTAYIYNMWIE